MNTPTIKEIIIKYLKKNGYSGLYNGDIECGCPIEDIPLCEYPNLDECKAGYKCKYATLNDCNEGCITADKKKRICINEAGE